MGRKLKSALFELCFLVNICLGLLFVLSIRTQINIFMNVAIVGTRNPGLSYKEWEQLLLSRVNEEDITLVVSGGAKGIDTYAKLFAGRHHIPLREYLPDYAKYGRKATLLRNTQIVRDSSLVVAFPSPDSRGTNHSIKEAQRLHKDLIVIKIPSKAD